MNSLADSAETVGVSVGVTPDLGEHGGLVEEDLLLRGLAEHVSSHVLVPHDHSEFLVHRGAVFVARVVRETKERAAKGYLCHGVVGDPVDGGRRKRIYMYA